MSDHRATDDDPIRIVTVCSHNRTRSVMTAAMLQSMLDGRLGPGAAIVESRGFGPEDLPSIPDAVDAMRRRGLDTSGHRSRQFTEADAEAADLVLCAERDHVIRVASMSPPAFRWTLTLPEFLTLGDRSRADDVTSVREWVMSLTADRTAREYLNDDIEEVDDPTGSAPRVFERAVVGMEDQCRRVVDLLVDVVGPAW